MRRLQLAGCVALGLSLAGATAFAAATPNNCSAEQAAVDSAIAAMKAATPGQQSPDTVKATKADYKAKKAALNCCKNPKMAGCAK